MKPFDMGSAALTGQAVQALANIGLIFDHSVVQEQIQALARAGAFNPEPTARGAMDSAFTAPVTTASIPTPLQFLQQWLPGFVKVMTAARKIDDILGVKTVGSWRDQEIVQGIVEPAGVAGEYGDFTDIPFTNWNTNFERRTIIRGEAGIQVGMLEEERASAMRLNSAETKRQQAAVSLEILRNAVGFYGYDAGNNRTFGLLNDPNLLPYITSVTGTGWIGASFQAICNDIRIAVRTLRLQSQDQVDPEKVDLTLVLPTGKVDLLTTVTDFGISVRDWLTQTYPKIRVVSAPEFGGANGTDDVFYLFADDIDSAIDGSSDGGEVFAQLVQTKFQTVGVEKRAKTYIEDYTNGTAGVLCKRPWAVVRVTGI
jgi:hypothetical protein